MRLPAWLTLMCAAMVLLWGVYRIKLGLRSPEEEAKAVQKKGLFGMPRRTHLLVGTIYLMLAAGLIAITLGWDPMAGLEGGSGDTAPSDPGPREGLEVGQ
jgi:hypothetical protein